MHCLAAGLFPQGVGGEDIPLEHREHTHWLESPVENSHMRACGQIVCTIR